MFSGIKNFLSRHKKKFIVSGIVVGGAILASKYAQRKIIEWQELETKDFLEKARKEQHFRSTEKTCNETIYSLSQTLRETILKAIDCDELLEMIRKSEGDKIFLWNALKVQVFAQLSSLLYSGLMLVIVLRVQLNVIGGYMFREKMDTQSHDLFTSSFQEHYLSLCNYFLNKGVKDICSLMEVHSRIVLEKISLKQEVTLQDIEHLFWAIQNSLNNNPLDPIRNLSKYLLPSIFNETVYKGVDSIKMKQIIDETFEILESEEVKSVADTCIKRAFSNVMDQIALSYYSSASKKSSSTHADISMPEDEFMNITRVSLPFAKIIPVIHGLHKKNLSDSSEWVQQFLVMDDINSFGANVYEAFS